ncbi:hypothetical protein D3C76_868440 [compost metagenome]
MAAKPACAIAGTAQHSRAMHYLERAAVPAILQVKGTSNQPAQLLEPHHALCTLHPAYRLPGLRPDHPRHQHCRGQPAQYRPRPVWLVRRYRMGGQCLPAGLRRLPAARRQPRRPLWPPAHAAARPGSVRPCLASLRRGAQPAIARPGQGRQGHRRVPVVDLGTGRHRQPLPPAAGAHARLGLLGCLHGRHHHLCAAARRGDRQYPGLALDLLHQPAVGGVAGSDGAAQCRRVPRQRGGPA